MDAKTGKTQALWRNIMDHIQGTARKSLSPRARCNAFSELTHLTYGVRGSAKWATAKPKPPHKIARRESTTGSKSPYR